MADMTLNEAYAQAWGAVDNPGMNGYNPHYRTRFATLGDVLGSIREACEPLGIAYQQCVERYEDCSYLRSYLVGYGESMVLSSMKLNEPADPQKLGSEMTYKRRYLAACDWGIVGDPDDDGNAAAGKQEAQPRQRPAQSAADLRKSIVEHFQELLRKRVAEGFNAGIVYDRMRGEYGTDQIAELSYDQIKELGIWLKEA